MRFRAQHVVLFGVSVPLPMAGHLRPGGWYSQLRLCQALNAWAEVSIFVACLDLRSFVLRAVASAIFDCMRLIILSRRKDW